MVKPLSYSLIKALPIAISANVYIHSLFFTCSLLGILDQDLVISAYFMQCVLFFINQ